MSPRDVAFKVGLQNIIKACKRIAGVRKNIRSSSAKKKKKSSFVNLFKSETSKLRCGSAPSPWEPAVPPGRAGRFAGLSPGLQEAGPHGVQALDTVPSWKQRPRKANDSGDSNPSSKSSTGNSTGLTETKLVRFDKNFT